MIIFLYGSDTYTSQQKLKEIIDHYKKVHQSGLNLKYFEGENLEFQDFKTEYQTKSMFGEKKLLVLKNVFLNKNFKENFLKFGKIFKDSTDLLLIYEKKEISQNDSLFKFLKQNSKSQQFPLLKRERLRNWIKKEFEKYGAEIKEKGLQTLIEFVGNDLWQISNEIKKLINYKLSQKKHKRSRVGNNLYPIRLDLEDVKLLIKPKIEVEVFKTIDAIVLKNKKKALQLLHKHLEKGDSPLYLLSLINFQFRNLLMIKSHQLGGKLYAQDMQTLSKRFGLHPYVIKKSYFQAQRFTFEELKKIYRKLFETDLKIKTGQLAPEIALNLLIAEI